MKKLDISVLVGSLRQKSWTRQVAQALVGLAPAGMNFSYPELGELPHYNEDLEAAPPAAFVRFRAEIAASDGVLFVTPEFNRGMPGVLKNAIDVGSRPWGKSVWSGKPAAVVSVSPGAIGAFGAHHQLRQVAVAVNLVTMPHPEAYIGNVTTLFGASGELADPKREEFLRGFMSAFLTWIEQQRFRGSES